MLYLIVDPDKSFAEKLADALAVDNNRYAQALIALPVILEIDPNATAPEIVELTIRHIKENGRPAAVFLASELPGVDENQMIDIIVKIGNHAQVVPVGNNLHEIIAAANKEMGGLPRCVIAMMNRSLEKFSVLGATMKIRQKNPPSRRPSPLL